MINEEVKNRLREYIKRCDWKWARTMPDVPHEYIYDGRCALTHKEYMDFLYQQVYFGDKEWWGKRCNPYLYIDGYKYWTMGDYAEENKTMNRQKIFDFYDLIADKYEELVSDNLSKTQRLQVAYMLNGMDGSVFEIGSGTGLILDELKIAPSRYQGIEPSKRMIELFRERHPNYTRRVRRKAFEEDGEKYADYDNTIALFGTASYIMRPYLERLSKKHRKVFLMFYREKMTPVLYKKADVEFVYFEHSVQELYNMFADCRLFYYDSFLVVTNMAFDLDAAMEVKHKQLGQTSLF